MKKESEVEVEPIPGRRGLSRLSGDGHRDGAVAPLAIGTPFPRQTLGMQPANHVLRKEHGNAGTLMFVPAVASGCHHAIRTAASTGHPLGATSTLTPRTPDSAVGVIASLYQRRSFLDFV